MYKVTYYVGNGSMVGTKWFPNLSEATQFSIDQPLESIIEIKLVKEENKRENRT